jgi:hypothetical protein
MQLREVTNNSVMSARLSAYPYWQGDFYRTYFREKVSLHSGFLLMCRDTYFGWNRTKITDTLHEDIRKCMAPRPLRGRCRKYTSPLTR